MNLPQFYNIEIGPNSYSLKVYKYKENSDDKVLIETKGFLFFWELVDYLHESFGIDYDVGDRPNVHF